jgi:hypothetical protein
LITLIFGEECRVMKLLIIQPSASSGYFITS